MNLTGPDGKLLPLKADPFGFEAELRPSTASVVADSSDFVWTDAAYMAKRAEGEPRRKPMSIYEVHLGSWRRHLDGTFLTYDELADQLIPYVVDMGYTHIELLPISEHPLDEFLGLPADRPLRSDAPLRRAGRFRPLRRPRACGRSRRHPRLGAGAFPHRRARSGALRRHRSVRARRSAQGASIRTGTPRSTISVGTRWRISSIATHSTGSTGSISTACASTPSLRCSTSTIPAAKASGCPTRTAARRTARRSPSSVAPTSSSMEASPARSPSPRNRRLSPASRARPTPADSASASSGTWGGCTTRSNTCRAIRSIAAGATTR